MKGSLDSQVDDWLIGRNGLTSHRNHAFHDWSATAVRTVRRMFAASN